MVNFIHKVQKYTLKILMAMGNLCNAENASGDNGFVISSFGHYDHT